MVGNLEGRRFLGVILILTFCRRTFLLFTCEINNMCVKRNEGAYLLLCCLPKIWVGYVNNFISSKLHLSIIRKPLLHVSAIYVVIFRDHQYIIKTCSVSTKLCQSQMVKYTKLHGSV